jgi:membrane-associated HD superfamily phosphohydrolase
MNENLDQDQAKTLNTIHELGAAAVAGRIVERAPKFQKFVSTILDNAKNWTNGERAHISDGETDITVDEIRLLLGGELWDQVEEDVKQEFKEEMEQEVREELEDEVKEDVRSEVLQEVQYAIENL